MAKLQALAWERTESTSSVQDHRHTLRWGAEDHIHEVVGKPVKAPIQASLLLECSKRTQEDGKDNNTCCVGMFHHPW
eukprot:1184716-Amphidinium_carterae.1